MSSSSSPPRLRNGTLLIALGLLFFGILGPTVSARYYQAFAQERACKLYLTQLARLNSDYQASTGSYAASLEVLQALRKGRKLSCPLGGDYSYRHTKDSFQIACPNTQEAVEASEGDVQAVSHQLHTGVEHLWADRAGLHLAN